MEKAQEKQYEVQDRWPLQGRIASLRPACIAEFQYLGNFGKSCFKNLKQNQK